VTDPPRTLVALATYNEIDNLPAVVDSLRRELPDADILVIDDNSPDGTGQWCDERAAIDERLRCLHRPGKQGLGTATIAAMRYAVENDYTHLATLDADHSHDPADVPMLLAAMERDGEPAVDVAIGSRYTPGGRIKGWPLLRRISSRGVNLLARLLLGIQVRDASGALRCYRVATLRRLDLDSLTSRGYSIYEETLWHLSCLGARIVERPITFVDRRQGSSKVNLSEAARSLGILLRLGARNWLGSRPLPPQ
jgi:dolichol-phosphate mannosyltransferase